MVPNDRVIRRRRKRNPLVYLYQKDRRYFAQIANSLKTHGAIELNELGAEEVRPEFSGIRFRADQATLYRINYESRLISRCLAPLRSFKCSNADMLYREARQIFWEDFIARGCTFAVTGNVSDSAISHSQYALLRVKDAVVDYFREKTGWRPDVSKRQPDILLNLYIRRNRAVISFDTSGGALHRRGYRIKTVLAPMQETVAAAMVRFSEWDGSVPLYDPLCGSGTILCEALMQYCRIPAGVFRERYGFERLPDFDRNVWHQVKKNADAGIRKLPKGVIAGSDVSAGAVKAARTNLMGIHHGKQVSVEKSDFNTLPALNGRVIITNPPYGIRIGKDRDLERFYKELGDFLKKRCKGATSFIYFGDRAYIKHIGLKPSWKKPLKVGQLDGRLVKYEMY